MIEIVVCWIVSSTAHALANREFFLHKGEAEARADELYAEKKRVEEERKAKGHMWPFPAFRPEVIAGHVARVALSDPNAEPVWFMLVPASQPK